MLEANIYKVQAQSLRAGDYLPATKQTVENIYHQGLNIPAGKVEVITRCEGTGGVKINRWGARTEIRIVRSTEKRTCSQCADTFIPDPMLPNNSCCAVCDNLAFNGES